MTRLIDRAKIPAVVLALLLASAGRLRADSSAEDRALATALFKEGRALMVTGRIPEACPKLEESHRLDPSGGTILNLALCHEQQGAIARSWSEFNEAIAFARRDGRRDREAAATAHASALEPRLSKLTIVVPERARVAGLRIERDGRELGQASWSSAMPVDGGDHVVLATAPGRRAFSTKVTIAHEASASTVEIPPLEVDPLALLATDPMLTTRTSAPPPAPPLLSPKARRRLGWTAGAAGAVQMGVAGIFGLRAFDKRQQSDDLCPGGACASQQGADLNDQAGTAADVSTILVVTGLATLAAAVYLLMTSPKGAGDRT
ncbi:MAG TPA: hypothetical protein VIQ54_05220 [Polyangia bacterium]|jgi:hypothetical protein